MPGSPSQWSAWKWVMKTASRSGRPAERSSCRWVPSPQSNSSRSPPRGHERGGQAAARGRRRAARPGEQSVELHRQRPPRRRSGRTRARRPRWSPPHRVGRRPAALRRRARVEDLEAVPASLVLGQVRVAEQHRVGLREPRLQPPSRSAARPASCTIAIRLPPGSTTRAPGSRRRTAASSTLPWTPCTGGPIASSVDHLVADQVAAVQDRVRRPHPLDAPSGSRRAPRGMWVSEMIASRSAPTYTHRRTRP